MYKSQKNRMVISLSDEKIYYLILTKDEHGFYISSYDFAQLDEGILKNGEILKADFLHKVLQRISKKISSRSIDLLLPHHLFLFDFIRLKDVKKGKEKKALQEYLQKNIETISWAKSHSYEYDFQREGNDVNILMRELPQEIYFSYAHIFKKAGFQIHSIQSELLAFSHLFSQENTSSQIFVDENHTYVLDYKQGLFKFAKKFNVSYAQFISDIKKYVELSDEKVAHIFQNYGILETHRDERVFKKMKRSMEPLIHFLRKKKMDEHHYLYLHFRKVPIKGFSLMLKRQFPHHIHDVCVLCYPQYPFHEVLSLHKKESYPYEPLIARALELFHNK